MTTQTTTQSGGIGVAGLLGVVFVALKLTGVIDWSWWWVTAPFWLPIVVFIAVCAVVFGGVYLWHLVRK